jgi:hypothetical protein
MAVAVVVTQRGDDKVMLFDDATAANAYIRTAANLGVLKNALKTSGDIGRPAILTVDDTELTPA